MTIYNSYQYNGGQIIKLISISLKTLGNYGDHFKSPNQNRRSGNISMNKFVATPLDSFHHIGSGNKKNLQQTSSECLLEVILHISISNTQTFTMRIIE